MRESKEVFGVPVSCVTVRDYLHLALWNTSELLVLCVTLVFFVVAERGNSVAEKRSPIRNK